MAIDQLIIGTFEQCFKKYIYDELTIGKLAHSEFKTGVNKGDEVDVIMPGTVNLFNYDGKDLPNAEEATDSVCKVRIDRGKAFHFTLTEMEKKYIENAPSIGQKVNLAKEYASDAVKQFAAAVDEAYGNLYTRAGHYVADDGGQAITLDGQIAKDLLALMEAKFKRGDGKGHTSWVDGQMVCVVPPEYQFYLGKMDDIKYTDMRQKELNKGFIGNLAGWDIMVSNNVAMPEEGVFYPLFGIKGKTLAGGISSDLNTKTYMPEKNFNTAYKGYGLYGVGAPRADYLGTAKIKAPLKLK